MSRMPQPQDDRTYTFAGRTFALFSIQHDTYCIPADEIDEQRCDELHRILREVCRNQIVLTPPGLFPPPGVDEPSVLDCGFGKGAWIDDLLGEYEDCEVTGVDIYLGTGDEDNEYDDNDNDDSESGVQEFVKKRWNLNARFREDRSASQLRPEQFHLINSRFLAEGIDADRWPTYIRELKSLLKPGGWLQMVELELRFQSDSGRLVNDSSEALYVWSEWYRNTMAQRNKSPRVGNTLLQCLQAAGFDSTWSAKVKLEIGGWNRTSASLGLDIRANLHKTLESILLWPCAGALPGQRPLMNPEQYISMVRAAQNQLQDESLKLYYEVYGVVSRSGVI